MRTFTKSSSLDNVSYAIRGPLLNEALRMEERGETIIKLNIGNPAVYDFHTPKWLNDEMYEGLFRGADAYSLSKGLLSTREAVAKYAKNKGFRNVSADDIYTGNGCSEMIIMCMQALLSHEDEVLLPAPDYPLWTSAVNLAGGRPVHYICDESSGWYPDLTDMESRITTKTKAIVLINPNNPTGAMYPAEILEKIGALAHKYQLAIFCDEIYDRLLPDRTKHVSIATVAPRDVFCVTLNGLSKSHHACGYRVGWIILSGNRDCAKDYIRGLDTLTSMRLCSNVPAQSIVPLALDRCCDEDDYLPGGRIYEQNTLVWQRLNGMPGVSAVRPQGAFYIFPRFDMRRFDFSDDEDLATRLLKEKKVLVVSGTGFNWPGADHCRIVCLANTDTLAVAMDRLSDFLGDHSV